MDFTKDMHSLAGERFGKAGTWLADSVFLLVMVAAACVAAAAIGGFVVVVYRLIGPHIDPSGVLSASEWQIVGSVVWTNAVSIVGLIAFRRWKRDYTEMLSDYLDQLKNRQKDRFQRSDDQMTSLQTRIEALEMHTGISQDELFRLLVERAGRQRLTD